MSFRLWSPPPIGQFGGPGRDLHAAARVRCGGKPLRRSSRSSPKAEGCSILCQASHGWTWLLSGCGFPVGVQVPLLLTLVEETNLNSSEDPRAGEDVAFVGFPEGQSTSLGMFPVLRSGQCCFPRSKSLRTTQFPDQWRCLPWGQRRARLSRSPSTGNLRSLGW